jgi:4-aminobutyrate aminotransferase-like enzyme
MQGNLQQNTDSEKLIDFLLEQSNVQNAGFDHCFLTSSGAMANENALKMAFQKRAPANRVMAFRKAFHGRTMSVSQITDKPKYRDGLPETLDVSYISFYDHTDHEGSIKRSLAEIDELLAKHPGEYALFMAELIQGEAGSWPGHKEFFRAIFTKLRENNISIIDDEVQSFGRTDKLFAFQYFEIDDLVDLVCIGKMSQVCATFYRADHKPRPGLISQTFTSSSTAIRASYYILSTIVNEGFLGENGKINKIHNYFKGKLEELHQKHPDKIEGPYGVGAMIAMTLYKGDMEKSKEFTLRLFENGVMSFIAGAEPTRVRMLIPMGIIETHHIDEVVKIIEKSL